MNTRNALVVFVTVFSSAFSSPCTAYLPGVECACEEGPWGRWVQRAVLGGGRWGRRPKEELRLSWEAEAEDAAHTLSRLLHPAAAAPLLLARAPPRPLALHPTHRRRRHVLAAAGWRHLHAFADSLAVHARSRATHFFAAVDLSHDAPPIFHYSWDAKGRKVMDGPLAQMARLFPKLARRSVRFARQPSLVTEVVGDAGWRAMFHAVWPKDVEVSFNPCYYRPGSLMAGDLTLPVLRDPFCLAVRRAPPLSFGAVLFFPLRPRVWAALGGSLLATAAAWYAVHHRALEQLLAPRRQRAMFRVDGAAGTIVLMTLFQIAPALLHAGFLRFWQPTPILAALRCLERLSQLCSTEADVQLVLLLLPRATCARACSADGNSWRWRWPASASPFPQL